VIGGVAERLLGSARTTDDFDICPEGSRENLGRLADVLNELEARWRPPGLEDEGFPAAERWSAGSFGSHTSLALLTRFGPVDVWLRPDGTDGYEDLIRRAVDVAVAGMTLKVVHVEDSIRIKRAIGGTKYLSHLPLLRALQRARRARGLD
jgi:hypothetical protein